MKKKLVALTLSLMAVATMCTACGAGKKEATEEKATTVESTEITEVSVVDEIGDEVIEEYVDDAPYNAFEERVGKRTFDSYEEIVGLLEGDEAYAYINVKGYDGQVLLIADYTYDNQDGSFATTEATIYSIKANGECTADGILYSGGTANPLAIDADGAIYCATHLSVDKLCYGYNGTDIPALMYLSSVRCETIAEDGTPVEIGGFVRTVNDLMNDDLRDLAADDVEAWNNAFDEYFNAQVIGFTRL